MSQLQEWLSPLSDKSGRLLLPILEDMRGRDNAVLIFNLGVDDPSASISAHLLEEHGEQIARGLKLLAETGTCAEVIIYTGDFGDSGIASQLKSLTGKPVSLKTGPASPVLREPTALYAVLDTGVIRSGNAEEEYQRSYLSYGYQGRPTLVADAETAYQAIRLHDAPGSALTKHVARIGTTTEITEVEVGTYVQELLRGTVVSQPVLMGGVWGSFVSVSDLKSTPISYSYFCDTVKVLDSTDCIVTTTAELYQSIRELSCSKCVLCREGSWQLAAIFNDMTEGKASREDIALLEDICPLISAGALCDFGRNMVLPGLTAATVCREVLTEHIVGKNCSTGRCKGLLSYVIDPALCTGCGDCLDVCPEEAIEGKDGFIHMIDDRLCVKCGQCVPSCPEGAIKCGGEKIKAPKKLTKVGKFH